MSLSLILSNVPLADLGTSSERRALPALNDSACLIGLPAADGLQTNLPPVGGAPVSLRLTADPVEHERLSRQRPRRARATGVRNTVRTAADARVGGVKTCGVPVVIDAVLLLTSGSGSGALTDAVFMSVPEAVSRTTISTTPTISPARDQDHR